MRRVIFSLLLLACAVMVGACGTEKSSETETVIKFRAEDVYHHENQLILKGYLLNIGDIEVTPTKLKLKVHIQSGNNAFNWNFEGIDLTSNEIGLEVGVMHPGDKRDLYIQLPDNNGIPVREIEVGEWNATGQVEF